MTKFANKNDFLVAHGKVCKNIAFEIDTDGRGESIDICPICGAKYIDSHFIEGHGTIPFIGWFPGESKAETSHINRAVIIEKKMKALRVAFYEVDDKGATEKRLNSLANIAKEFASLI